MSNTKKANNKRVTHRKKETEERPIRIYCDGIYDLFHFGHSKSLEQVKHLFPRVHLIVGVCTDEDTIKYKGKPVMSLYERAESVRHCKWVDQEGAPWIITQKHMDEYEIDYVAHDAEPYKCGEQEDIYAFLKQQDKFIPTKRTPSISTSDLITRIIREYHAFVRRNLERGVSPRELNISMLTEGELWLQRYATKFLRGFCKDAIDQVKGILSVCVLMVVVDNWKESTGELIEVIQKKSKRLRTSKKNK